MNHLNSQDWGNILEKIKPEISATDYRNWIDVIKYKEHAILLVPNIFVKEYLTERFTKYLKDFMFEFEIKPYQYEIKKLEENRRYNLEEVGMYPEYFEASFENCKNNPLYPYDPKMLNSLEKWSINPQGYLILLGYTGTGKTYLSSAVLRKYMETSGSSNCKFMNISEFNQYFIHKKGDIYPEVKKFTQVNLLVIDDLGLKSPSDTFLECLYSIFNGRRGNLKATLITTNINDEKLMSIYGDRIYSRIASGTNIVVKNKDLRFVKSTMEV